MLRLYTFVSLLILLAGGCTPSTPTANMKPYPTTKQVDQVDDYFGTAVADPYRWLEDDRSAETEDWVKAQNEVTFDYLKQIPFRDALRDRFQALFNYERISSPRKVGEYVFFSKNDGLQNQSVIFIQEKGKEPEVFIDPNALSKEGIVSISLLGASQDDRYIAYARSEAGSDWTEIRVIEIATRKELPDVLTWVKFSGTSWLGNGFFYSAYPKPEEGTEFSGASEYQRVYYHELGTEQADDLLIYEDTEQPNMYHRTYLTEDKAYLVMIKSSGTDGFETWFKPADTKAGGFQPLFTGFTNKNSILDHHEGKFLVLTDVDAPNYRLVSVDPAKVETEHWEDIIPEREHILEYVSTGGGKLFPVYLENAFTKIYQMDYDGSNQKGLDLPAPGAAGIGGVKKTEKEIYYSFSSYTYPPTIYRYDIESGTSEEYFQPTLAFDPEDFETKQLRYPSKDGTVVSMFVVHKKGLALDGSNPTYLYGYGGFNISMNPNFTTTIIPLLEAGGVFVVVNLRGGGEYGETWHQAGMLEKKQNVFDDFIAAAEYLIAEGYTSSEKLAIGGGSNGGLLVGACMTQRPDLFAAAFPAVGVMDMLRYHKFTVGWGWVPEYGNAENSKEEFDYLYAYSPLHNLKEGVTYPSTLVTTADHDDRVVPAHSFKFAATLQKAHTGTNPVLIRVETQAGHGAGKPIAKILDEQADKWAFMLYQTGESF
ncbi:MAG: prolyl oligopeptidase family serine peptidase [Bacteroidota bacterium]